MLELVGRKYKADGLADTLSNVWMDFWEKFVLNDHVTPGLLKEYGLELKHQSDLETDANFHRSIDFVPIDSRETRLEVPSKKWIDEEKQFSEVSSYPLEPPAVCEFTNATLLPTTGLCISADGEYIADSITPPSRVRPRVPVSISRSLIDDGALWAYRSIIRFESDYLRDVPEIELGMPIIPLWMGYYHWLIEMLPRLVGAEQYYKDTGERPTVLVPRQLPSWAQSLLSIFTDGKYDVAVVDEPAYTVNRLVLPTFTEPSPMECSWIQSITAEYSAKPEFPNRIFISREGANRRRIKNKEPLSAVLDEFDIEPVALEGLPVPDQIRLFRGVDLVVGPHGAGFSNVVFSDNPTLLEIFGDRKKTTFYRLARILGHDYHHVQGQTSRNDIVINPNQLRRKIRDCIKDGPGK
jgi:hypothetical protein